MSLRWDVLRTRSNTWEVCALGDGQQLAAWVEAHNFVGRDDATRWRCIDTAWLPADRNAGSTSPYRCDGAGTSQRGTVTVVGEETVRVASSAVDTVRLRVDVTETGEARGPIVEERWLEPVSGLPGPHPLSRDDEERLPDRRRHLRGAVRPTPRQPAAAPMSARRRLRDRWAELQLAPDARPRPDAPFGRGPLAARILAQVIDGATVAGCRLPTRVAHVLAVTGGTAEWAVRPAKRRRLAENLAHAAGRPPDDPVVRRLVRREILNEARRSADLLWALGKPEELADSTEIQGLEHVHAALAGGRGVVLAGIHLGGWEVATAIPKLAVPVPTTAIVADDWLAWAIEHMRVTAGLRVLYRTATPLRAARVLRDGEALLVLADDGAGHEPRSFRVRFLDGWVLMPAGVVSLARLAGAPIVSFYVLPRGPRRWRVVVDPPVDPPARGAGDEGERRALQQLADRWSEEISAHPDQWAATYPVRWVEGPERAEVRHSFDAGATGV